MRTRRRPNVIFAFSDEHRYHSTSTAGMRGLRTPSMERMAAEGVEFTHCVSNYPVCSPHRAILMTGRWPFQQGIVDNALQLDPAERTLGKAFKEAGYSTAYVGKWHLGGTRAEPFGFDHSLIWTGTSRHWASRYWPAGDEPVDVENRYNAEAMTEQALEWIDRQREDPFFLVLSWDPPHSVFTDAPEDKKALYPPGSIELRPNYRAGEGAGEKRGSAFDSGWEAYQGYHAHVTAVDEQLGRLMDALERMGMAEDTVVVYTSDHGSQLGSHGLVGKRLPFEESIRVPFYATGPGIGPAGAKVDALFGTIDLARTLCALAGVPAPETFLGQDFSPWFRGEAGPRPESQFIMHIQKERASRGNDNPAPLFRGVATERFTYAVQPGRPWCLFDNQGDPHQLSNLVADPRWRTLRRELRHILQSWLNEAEDPFETPPENA